MEVLKKRDERIDILRALAILCIILAHSSPNDFIFQLRNFDVTMMVFLMGVSFFLSNQNKRINYSDYVIKRFRRLILPTWKFLILFFVVFFFLSIVLNDDYYFSLRDIITSFAMTTGIGYVWIMRVFFIIALVSPLLLYISNRIKKNSTYFILLVIAYVIYLILLLTNEHLSVNIIQKLFEYYIVEGFGYSLIAALGIRLYSYKKQYLPYLAGIFFIIFSILGFYHNFMPTQAFKYPPTLYYLSYGIFVSLILFYFLSFEKIKGFFTNKPIMFLSFKSLDLYFCHIIPVYIIQLYGEKFPIVSGNFITRFLFILIGALVLLSIQIYCEKVLKVLKNKRNFGRNMAKGN